MALKFYTKYLKNAELEKFPPNSLHGFAFFTGAMSGIVNASQNCHFNAVLQVLSNVHRVLTLLDEHAVAVEREPSKLFTEIPGKIQMNYSDFFFFPTIQRNNTASSYLHL